MFNLQELAKLRMAYKRNDPSKLSEKLREQYDSGDYVEYKVQLVNTEVNDFQELWKIVDEEKYVSRYVCGLPTWYSVCDPKGYAELDCTIKPNVVFVICDRNGEPLFGTSNVHGAEFLTLDQTCIKEWNRIKADYPHCKDNTTEDFWMQTFGNGTTIGADQWLLTFKDPEIYGDAARDYDENWIFHQKLVKREPLSGFSYLGKNLCIFRDTYEQTDCKKQIINYFVRELEENSNVTPAEWGFSKFLDSWFDGEPGTMYLEREAKKIVADAIKEIYDGEQISKVINSYGYVHESFYTYKEAAEELLRHSWNRKHVVEVIEKEKQEHSFYKVSDPEIEIKFPGVVRDHEYNYDFLGRRIA